jgi:CRISPR-associated protein Cas1
MPPLYITEQGAKLHIENRRAVVSVLDRETAPGTAAADRELANVPLLHVSEVVLLGNIGLTTPAIKLLLQENIDVVFLTIDGQYCGRLIGPGTPHVALRRKQYRAQSDAAFTQKMAQVCVTAKLEHLRALLQRHNRERNNEVLRGAVELINQQLQRVPRTTTIPSLSGVEGAATAAYFGGLRQLLSADWKFTKRQRRPPPDPINVLLSFGYTLLAHAAEGAVAATGLDVYAGFLHSIDYNRPSLALDVMEEFRPLIDSVVLWCCNGGQITPEDFTPGTNPDRPVVMSDRARKRFIEAYERRMAETFTHPTLNQKLAIRQCLLAQARQVAEAIQSDRPGFIPMGFR